MTHAHHNVGLIWIRTREFRYDLFCRVILLSRVNVVMAERNALMWQLYLIYGLCTRCVIVWRRSASTIGKVFDAPCIVGQSKYSACADSIHMHASWVRVIYASTQSEGSVVTKGHNVQSPLHTSGCVSDWRNHWRIKWSWLLHDQCGNDAILLEHVLMCNVHTARRTQGIFNDLVLRKQRARTT